MKTNSEPLLIWGAGAIGGTLGAYWKRAGHDVLLVDIDATHVQACSRVGLTIEGPVEPTFTQVIPACTPDTLTGRYSRVILAVKAHAAPGAIEAIAPHLSEDGFVLSAQNGLNERIIKMAVGAERTMGAFVNFGADWQAPGRILYGNRGAVVIGELDGEVRERTRAMHTLLSIFEPDAIVTEDIDAWLWGKLGYGAMLFATALTDDSMSANFSHPDRTPVLIELAREVMRVAAHEGVHPRGFNGFDPSAFSATASDSDARESIDALAEFTSRTAKTHSGIHRDLAIRKRRTEVDAQLGTIVSIAGQHGIKVPLLTRLVDLIHAIENGERTLSSETFAALTGGKAKATTVAEATAPTATPAAPSSGSTA